MAKNKETEAKKYIKDNLLKQIGKQKLFELGIIPTIIIIIYYVPYWVGLQMAKAIGYDNYLSFINSMNNGVIIDNVLIQDSLTRGDFWLIGFITTIILAGFLMINIGFAISKLKDRAVERFNVHYYDLSDFSLMDNYK